MVKGREGEANMESESGEAKIKEKKGFFERKRREVRKQTSGSDVNRTITSNQLGFSLDGESWQNMTKLSSLVENRSVVAAVEVTERKRVSSSNATRRLRRRRLLTN